MNVTVPLRLDASPVRLAAAELIPEPFIRLGMPHLSGCGLSENWLLKELGHRHWTMLAETAGSEGPDFRDEEGRPVYAAFCAVRLGDARLELGAENGRLVIRSALRRVSRTQIESRHELLIDGRAAGTLEMISTFIKRTGRGNHCVARVALDGLMPVDPAPSELAALAASLRSKRLSRHLGFDLAADTRGIAEFTFDPCPEQDFNGAGFLYFPSFPAFVDRAEWQIDRHRASLAGRETFYYGNVDPGEDIRVILVGEQPDAGARLWRIERTGSRSLLAEIFTRRAERPERREAPVSLR